MNKTRIGWTCGHGEPQETTISFHNISYCHFQNCKILRVCIDEFSLSARRNSQHEKGGNGRCGCAPQKIPRDAQTGKEVQIGVPLWLPRLCLTARAPVPPQVSEC